MSAQRSGSAICAYYFLGWPYAYGGSDVESSSAVSGPFGRTFDIRNVMYVSGCSATTTMFSMLSPGYASMTASGSGTAPNTYSSPVSYTAANSASLSYEFVVTKPALARVVVAAAPQFQTQGASLYRVDTIVPKLSIANEGGDVQVELEPGRYQFSASANQDAVLFEREGPDYVTSSFAASFALATVEQNLPCPSPWYELSKTAGEPPQLGIQDLAQQDDIEDMAELQAAYRQTAQRLRALSYAAASMYDDSPSLTDAIVNLAVDLEMLDPQRARAVIELLDIALSARDPEAAVQEHYAKATQHLAAAGAAIMDQLANSLPDYDYGTAQYGCIAPSDLGLLGAADGPYSPLAKGLADWRAALGDLELAARAFSRATAAARAGNATGFAVQRSVFSAVLTSADTRLLSAAEGLARGRELLSAGGESNTLADPTLLARLRDEVRAQGFTPAVRDRLTALGFTSYEIDRLVSLFVNQTFTGFAAQDLFALADASAVELPRDTARAQLTPAAATTVPAGGFVSAVVLSLGLLGVALLRPRWRVLRS